MEIVPVVSYAENDDGVRIVSTTLKSKADGAAHISDDILPPSIVLDFYSRSDKLLFRISQNFAGLPCGTVTPEPLKTTVAPDPGKATKVHVWGAGGAWENCR